MTGPSPRLISGRYAILAVVALSVAGAGGAWWYWQSLQRRPLELWGREAASLIVRAAHVELCRLEPTTNDAPPNTIEADGQTYQPIDCVDAGRIRGFLHLRHSLLNDYSFDWTDPPRGERDWGFVIRFRDDARSATLLISRDLHYVWLNETGATASIKPIAPGIKQVFEEAWAARAWQNSRARRP